MNSFENYSSVSSPLLHLLNGISLKCALGQNDLIELRLLLNVSNLR